MPQEGEWSLFRVSVTHSESLRMESFLQGWNPASPKWLLFLSLSTAPSFLVLTYVEGDDAAGQLLPGTIGIWTLSQFRVCLIFGQLPRVSLLLSPSAQSGLCILDFLSVIIHLSYLYFDHLLADAVFYYVFTCSTMTSLDSIVTEIIEIIILNSFKTVQLSFAVFFFFHWSDLNVSTTSFSGQHKNLLSSLQAKWALYTVG